MKQVLQHLKNGETEVAEVPTPQCQPGHVLIQTHCSLISPGTERMLVEFGQAGWLSKAKQQPDKVKAVLDKIRTDGLFSTVEAVLSKLDKPMPLGYSNVGHVIAVGEGVHHVKIGDRVLSNGSHAEVVSVPKNLSVRVPDEVTDDQAVFGVLGAIALQGIRLAKLELGESVAVFGLGLIGLLTVQLLRAQGCRVLAIDFDEARLMLAEQFGAMTVNLSTCPDPLIAAMTFSRERGIDAVLITAASRNNDLMHQAAQISRQRGRIILVGTAGLQLSRADFYEKELTFQVSCSYGPGRYDKAYEKQGHDYPVGFVRFTEQRNFETILDLMAAQQLKLAPLISHQFSVEQATDAYRLLMDETQTSLGILMKYLSATEKTLDEIIQLKPQIASNKTDIVKIGFIGAGNYAAQLLIPAFKKTDAMLQHIVSSGGVNAKHLAKKFGFKQVSSQVDAIFADEQINLVVIATQHDTHADFICRALAQHKKVYVEKPLAIRSSELDRIISAYQERFNQNDKPFLMVGFNRRFSSLIQKMRTLLASTTRPKAFVMTVNAGFLAQDHWTQDLKIGGGRIVGEACHMIDLLRYLAGAKITGVQASAMGQYHGQTLENDQVTITLSFADGSLGTVHYFANGNKALPKERLEVFCEGRVLQLDNFKALRAYGYPKFKEKRLWRQDKGHQLCVQKTVEAVRQGLLSPISFEELVEVTQATFTIMDHLHQ